IVAHSEASDIGSAAFIKHVQQILVKRQADWTNASRTNHVNESQVEYSHPQDGNLIAAGVNCEQELIAVTQNQRALRSEWVGRRIHAVWNRISCATSRKFTCGCERATSSAMKNRH